MSDLRWRKGEAITAQKLNLLVDRVELTSSGYSIPELDMARSTSLVKNASGTDRDMGELLQIDPVNAYVGPDSTEIYNAPAQLQLEATDPVWHTGISNVVVCAEPIPDGESGVVVTGGLCIIRASSASATDDFLMIDPDEVNRMKGSSSGIAKRLARIDGADEWFWALFRHGQNQWMFELTEVAQAPNDTNAKLLNLDGTEFASSINLSDPLSVFEGESSGYRGMCGLCGNLFISSESPC